MLLPLTIHSSFLLIFFLIFSLPHTILSRTISKVSVLRTPLNIFDDAHTAHDHDDDQVQHKFEKLIHATDDQTNYTSANQEIISDLKRYLHHFGYLHHTTNSNSSFHNLTAASEFDDSQLKHAIIKYQTVHNLPITGSLTAETISLLITPRCGVPDHPPPPHQTSDNHDHNHTTKHYVYFPGKPRWSRPIPMTLTYSFSKTTLITYLTFDEIKNAFRNAFAKWESTIPVTFIEAKEYQYADIKIGFYRGDHGDGEPFDGKLGVLGHAFSPEDGRFHLDKDEIWSIDFEKQKSKSAIDLESVVLHEIGHVLGLGHSFIKDSVMYPSLKPRSQKLDLKIDDIRGVQSLYGSNPNFSIGSLLEEAETSSSSPSCSKPSTFLVVVVLQYCCTVISSLVFYIFI